MEKSSTKTIGWIAGIIVALVILGYFTRKYWMPFFSKTVDGNKGKAPSGCGPSRVGNSTFKGLDEGDNPAYYYQFNKPYYRYKKGDKIIGNCKTIWGGDFSDSYDCDTINFYSKNKQQEIDSSYVDKLDMVLMPVIGLTDNHLCSKPIYDTVKMPNASEVCFTASDLGLQNGDILPEVQKISYRNLGTKTWRYNRQLSNGTYCYVYNPDGKYPVL